MATLAPYPLEIREARTPPDPAPITTKSYVVSSSLLLSADDDDDDRNPNVMGRYLETSGLLRWGTKEEVDAAKVKSDVVKGVANLMVLVPYRQRSM